MGGLTFTEYRQRWEALPGSVVLEMFGGLPEREQAEAWDDLAGHCEQLIDAEFAYEARQAAPWCPVCRDRTVEHEPGDCPKRHQPVIRSTAATSTRSGTVWLSSGDPLKATPPSEYVEAFTGETVPASGFIHCPLHEERTPSFRVYEDHWHCFGCHKTGGVYELASRLSGLSTRGADFLKLRRWIAAALLERRASRHER